MPGSRLEYWAEDGDERIRLPTPSAVELATVGFVFFLLFLIGLILCPDS